MSKRENQQVEMMRCIFRFLSFVNVSFVLIIALIKGCFKPDCYGKTEDCKIENMIEMERGR